MLANKLIITATKTKYFTEYRVVKTWPKYN